MIPELPYRSLPEWILAAVPPLSHLPICDLLAGSVYYPACKFDGDPVKYLGGNFHSFVYVDYGVGRDQLLQNLNSFHGYRIAAFREVAERELIPNGWTPRFPRTSDGGLRRQAGWIKRAFGVWSIYQRSEDFNSDHGPDCFSLLYIGGDGVATFQALYEGNRVAPAVVAVIQPGHGSGGNWTNFEDADGIFARSVLENPSGTPEYLLFGGWGEGNFYREPCWPSYDSPVRTLHGRLRLWRRSSEPNTVPDPTRK